MGRIYKYVCARHRHYTILYATIQLSSQSPGETMYKFIKVSAILLLALLAIGLAVFIFFPTSKYAAENARAADAVKNLKLVKECFRLYGLNHGFPEEDNGVTLENMQCPVQIHLGQWDEEAYGFIGHNFNYSMPICTHTECTVEAIRWPEAAYSLTLTHREKNCYTQNTKLGRYICKRLKKQGWTYMNEKI